MKANRVTRTGYIPTVDGKPARFCGEQLCIAGGRNWHVVIVPTLREVRRQIRATQHIRLSWGLSGEDERRYSYVRVRL